MALSADQPIVYHEMFLLRNDSNERVPVIQVVPITEWSEKRARIRTNVELTPTAGNGLTKKSVADCLQTRPIDHRYRLVRVRGQLNVDELQQINAALKMVFELE